MNILELMHDHVRAIYRAATGEELAAREPQETTPIPVEALTSRFVELDRIAREIPTLAERLPAVSVTAPIDVLATEREMIVEVGVPGADPRAVRAELNGQLLVVSGTVEAEKVADASYYRAEIARGPFSRFVELPHAIVGDPRIEVDRGIIHVRVAKATKTPRARA